MTQTATATKTATAKGSRKTPFPITIAPSSDPIDELQSRINQAQGCHLATKQSAMEAVAHAYLYSCLVAADWELQDWEKSRITELNDEIKKHNDRLDEERKRAEDFVFDRLDPEDGIYVAKTEEEKNAASDEKAWLKTIAARTDKEWKALRKVQIKARDGASDYTVTVKFVFGLDEVTDASTVSRYSYVLEWVQDNFKSSPVASHEPIVQAIVDAGGFERVLEEKRTEKSGKPPKPANDNADKKAKENDAKAEAIRKSVQGEPAKVEVEVDLNRAEGLVIVLGRYSKGVLEIVRSFNVSPNELNKLLVSYASDAINKD